MDGNYGSDGFYGGISEDEGGLICEAKAKKVTVMLGSL